MYAAPTLILIDCTEAYGAPGTVDTSGTIAFSFGPNGFGGGERLPVERISIEAGEVPSVKNASLLPDVKNAWTVAFSSTRELPKLTTPSTSPFGLATDFFGQ